MCPDVLAGDRGYRLMRKLKGGADVTSSKQVRYRPAPHFKICEYVTGPASSVDLRYLAFERLWLSDGAVVIICTNHILWHVTHRCDQIR